jgi:membrane-bound lytic murein transglycosylase B
MRASRVVRPKLNLTSLIPTMTQSSLALASLLMALLPASADPALMKTAGFDLSRPEIRAFVDDVASRDRINRTKLYKILAKAEPQPKILELMSKPAERVSPWWEYRERFLTEKRINEGVQFWRDHREMLDRISAEHGVPAEYLVAIIGVETFYGRITGRFRVLDALATLSFDYPPRAPFFRGELEEFLLLALEEDVDPLKTLGSYAGAMGVPQFMPSSYRKYAIDGGTDNKRNLWQDADDVLASVANYFRKNGWQTGGPVIVDAVLDPDAVFQIDTRNLELNQTLDSLSALGVQTNSGLPGDTPAMLISAEQKDGPAYRVAFNNFRTITRYNRSARYAMAVNDLAQALRANVDTMQAGGVPASGK